MAVLRKNLLDNKNTLITYSGALPEAFDAAIIKNIYGYQFELKEISSVKDIPSFDGSVVYISEQENVCDFNLDNSADFIINYNNHLGSILVVNGDKNAAYNSEIQHVRRRETIAMTPANTLIALQQLVDPASISYDHENTSNTAIVIETIKNITESKTNAIVASSGLSIQYAIVMGLIHEAMDQYPGKDIKVIVPPNCYGGTNDQARRIAACLDNVEVMDLPVDGEHDMVDSIDTVLAEIASQDAVPYIIAEIPTNPRVEVPDLEQLKNVLSKARQTSSGANAIEPVFILDQTFCPNVHFLGEDKILSSVKTIAYVSGSKFLVVENVLRGFVLRMEKRHL